ncbi:DUF1289 domain-containing protein [Spongiibacter sp. KMU-166]|uniref:DUF1289 domain-containing protein n=1 Tax=Spongiibacter thalassae TaxID=2721624 RepID=A0ABX1G9J8_9GAMM|nr:DUF1289 domain-containing protein [Spongiibacter thalassae]
MQKVDTENTVKSPCVRVCKFNADGHCLGCFRHLGEVEKWMVLKDHEKIGILKETKKRRENYWDSFKK